MTRLLVIEGPRPTEGLRQAVRNATARLSGPLDVLSFVEDPDRTLAEALPGNVSARFLPPAEHLGKTLEETRHSLSRFVHELFPALNQVADGLSPAWGNRFRRLWWYAELSEKNSPGCEGWWELFRLAAIRSVLDEYGHAEVILVGGPDLRNLTKQLCEQRKLDFSAYKHGNPSSKKLFSLLALRLKNGLAQVRACLAAKKCTFPAPAPDSTLVFSKYPRKWVLREGQWLDMYLGLSADRMREAGLKPFYLFRLYDDLERRTRIRAYRERLHRLQESGAPGPGTVLERFYSPWELVRRFLCLRDCLQLWRTSRQKGWRKAFLWEGIDCSEICTAMLRHSALLWWPHLLCLESATRRAAKSLQPVAALLYTFEHLWGDAWINGLRSSGGNIHIIGMQHGPITPAKLLYSGVPGDLSQHGQPWPDKTLVDGEASRRLLAERGVPEHQLEIVGAARFDPIWDRAREAVARRRDRGKPVRILAGLGLHDAEPMLRFVLAALAGESDIELIVKPHPRTREGLVKGLLKRFRAEKTVRLVNEGEIYSWMEEADVFLASYSSTAVEAIAFGLPIILILPARTPDMSMFHGPEAVVLSASTPEELRKHARLLADDPQARAEYMDRLAFLPERLFSTTDGKAALRLTGACSRFILEG
ncbi:MAG: hypothetical protein AB7E32_15215 [Desulfovibrio sp.]